MPSKFFSNVRGDIFGGLTTSVVALPLAVAFGVAAFSPLGDDFIAVGALAGLFASIIAGALASLCGGTPSQISGPTAPMAVVVTSVIVRLMNDPEITSIATSPTQISKVILLFVAVTIVLGGFFQICLGLIGGGKLIKFIPYPVVAGFMNGIAVIIFLAQLRPILGVPKGTRLLEIFKGGSAIQWETLVVGLTTVIAVVVAGRYIKAVPGALIGLLVGIGIYFLIGGVASARLLELENNDLIIGAIPSAVPEPTQLFTFFELFGQIPLAKWSIVAVPALTLGVLAAIDTLLTSVVADVATKTKHRSNRELIGQGIGNVASALFGGLPAAGSTSVTMVNVNAGGRTPLSGVVKSVVVLLVVLVLSPLVQWIPMAVLGGILAVTAVRIVDWESLRLFRKKSTLQDVFVVLTVTVITVSVDLMVAVGIGLVIASFLFVKDQIGKTVIRRRYTGDVVHSKKVRDRVVMEVLERHGGKIKVYELSGSLFFGTCDRLFGELEKDFESLCIILDLKRVNTIDLTGALLIRQIVDRVKDKGNHLLLSFLDIPGNKDKEMIRRFLDDLSLPKAVGEDHIFPDTDRALEWAEDTLIKSMSRETGIGLFRIREVLGDIEVFKDLGREQMDKVEPFLKVREFPKGENIFEEGDEGDGVYFILSGYVSVMAGVGADGRVRRLTTFSEGVFFGDMALLEGKARSATVRAEADTKTLFMSNQDFVAFREKHPELASEMLLGIARELSWRLRRANAEVRTLAE